MLRLGRDRHEASGNIVAALDLGSSRIACMIARIAPERGAGPAAIKVIALAQQRARGVRAGAVVDLGQARDAVRAVVAEAEAVARLNVRTIDVAVNCGPPRSTTFCGRVRLPEGIVGDRDLAALDEGASSYAQRSGEAVISLRRLGFRLDGVRTVEPPSGLAGRVLEADHVAVTVEPGPLCNLEHLLEACHLRAGRRVVAAHASALAATTELERRLGVTCLDIGGEVTTIAGYADGSLVHCGIVPVGGQHATTDIARALSVPLVEAERIKALYGSLVLAASDAHDHITLHGSSGGDARVQHVPKSVIGQILRQRMRGVLAQAGEQVAASGVGHVIGARLVLTGGSCQLLGLADFAAGELDRPVRIGFPPVLPGLPGGMAGASFACLAGVVMASLESGGIGPVPMRSNGEERGYVGRVEQWLRESF